MTRNDAHFPTAMLDALEDLADSQAGGARGVEALSRSITRIGRDFGLGWAALLLHNLDAGTGYLAASSQSTQTTAAVLDPTLLSNAKKELSQGEILETFSAEHPLVNLLSDVSDLPELHSMVWQPVHMGERHVGTLLLGWTQDSVAADRQSVVRLAQVAARMASVAVRDNPLLHRLKEQTRPLRKDSQKVTAVEDVLERYHEFFSGSADGVVIADRDGKIRYVNRAAETISGYSSDWLSGRKVLDLIAAAHRDGLAEVLEQTFSGAFLQSFDVDVATTSGDLICVHMSATLLPGNKDLLVLTFRDITETRAVEMELIQTKEFLERLIGSTVDAIVCADTTGTLILFNPGAERLFGYTADDVLGKMRFSDLFPADVAATLSKQLRSAQYGGEGRLEPTRKEVVSRDGEQIPVNLTASVIYGEQEELGVVGIFSDLRDRLRLEQRLMKSQEKLMQSEKHALIAELAGTTAHELNQPLTSIMGYAELLMKNLKEDNPNRRPAEVIMGEAERMAEIVRKIGKITRYETKAYVGSAQILDLDKSAE